MADKEAAGRLKYALRVAMTAKGITGWAGLAKETGVSPHTIENWVYANSVPQPKQLRQVGDYLRPFTSPAALEDAYAGLPPSEVPLTDVLRAMAPDLHELVVLLRAQTAVSSTTQTCPAGSRQRRGQDDDEPPDVRLPGE